QSGRAIQAGEQIRRWIGNNLLSVCIGLLYCIYAGIFIYRTSFLVQGVRYFCLFDDAMISMRYARNLAHGDGLVWNPGGAHVEGYTNPLWVLYMGLLHLLPVLSSKICLLVQISSALILCATLFVIKQISDRITGSSWIAALCAMTLTAL